MLDRSNGLLISLSRPSRRGIRKVSSRSMLRRWLNGLRLGLLRMLWFKKMLMVMVWSKKMISRLLLILILVQDNRMKVITKLEIFPRDWRCMLYQSTSKKKWMINAKVMGRRSRKLKKKSR